MRFLYAGDVVGRAGRKVVHEHLAALRRRLKLDAVVLNGENAAGGFGLSADLLRDFIDAGCDVVTLGNHAFDQRDIIPVLDSEPRLVRPLNLLPGTPGRGVAMIETSGGQRLVVMQVLCRLFMSPNLDDPFAALEAELARFTLGGSVDAILIDVHGEATSEKMALGHFVDGRASLVAGTHTHVPTADLQILPGGTAYISDVGMCGDYDSVIGMEKSGSLHRFRSALPGPRMAPALGEATFCAVFVETDPASGLALCAEPVRLGGRLAATLPER